MDYERNDLCLCGRRYWQHFDGWNGNPWFFTEEPQCDQFRLDDRRRCEECGEPTEELYERGDLKLACEGCLNGVDEDFLREMVQ